MDIYTAAIGAFVLGIIIGRITKQSDAPVHRPQTPISIELPQDAEVRIKELVYQGRVIDAIKQLREATGLGLKESKEIVDRLRNGQNCEIRALIERQRSGQ